MSNEVNLVEVMTVAASKEVKDYQRVFVGVGLPVLAAALAKKIHAPHALLCTEHGLIDFSPVRFPPLSVVDPGMIPGAAMLTTMLECLGVTLQGGWIDVGFLGAAQIDKRGNLNSTVIGDYSAPKVRLVGSGGANDIASNAKEFIIIMRGHDRRKFVERVDYVTSPGYLDGPGSREKHGLKGGGPSAVISDLGIFRFDENKEMYLEFHHPGVSIERVKENTSWDLKISSNVKETPRPTKQEIEILHRIDPLGIYLKSKA